MFLLATLACQPEPRCATADNGICDELAGCTLGTDWKDCNAACAEVPWPEEALAACAYDGATAPEPVEDPALGSLGEGGLAGTWDGTVVVRGARAQDEVERHFRVYVPRRYDPEMPTPVLFNLGGFTVDAYFLDEFTELNRTADLNDFIVVYGQPEWRDFGSYWVWGWYVYQNAWNGGWDDNPDLEYLQAVLDEVSSLYNVDGTRVYVSGHSRGAGLSLIAGFELPEVFAGFCSQSGFADVNDYDARMAELDAHPRAVLVHGDADPDVKVKASDRIYEDLVEQGWTDGEDVLYYRLEGVTHRWQPQYNEQVWAFLNQETP
ncbi:MAG TPA: PHB depolymerase family esterase [Myxococcota bacterium]|nr:PHB depolymerase family esterase [Myxococcota bacterium]